MLCCVPKQFGQCAVCLCGGWILHFVAAILLFAILHLFYLLACMCVAFKLFCGSASYNNSNNNNNSKITNTDIFVSIYNMKSLSITSTTMMIKATELFYNFNFETVTISSSRSLFCRNTLKMLIKLQWRVKLALQL